MAATGNRIAQHVMHAIRDVMRRALMSIYLIPGSAERSNEQHRAVFEAVVAGRADEARQRMREHLLRVEGAIEEGRAVRAPVAGSGEEGRDG